MSTTENAERPAIQKIFLTWPDLQARGHPWTRIHTNRLIAIGEFPTPVQLSANRIAWKLAEIEAWEASRPLVRRTPGQRGNGAPRP